VTPEIGLIIHTMNARRIIPLILVIAALFAYHNCYHAPFVFDDQTSIVENYRIRKLWPLGEVLTQTSRPVVHLTLALNYAISGLDVWSYHAFNVMVHILAALTLYGVIRRTLLREGLRNRFGSEAAWLAGAVALIWLVHPLQTEAVTYIIQRAVSLMGLFYLLTLYCVIRAIDSANPIRWYGTAVICCAVGMATKPIMVTAPLVILLYDYVFVSQSLRDAFRQRWVLYVALAATWLILPWVLSNSPAEWKPDVGGAVKNVAAWQYALSETPVLLHYLQLSIWPHPLCFDYVMPVLPLGDVVLPAVIVLGLLAATAWALWHRQAVGFLGAWFFVILAPTSGVIPIIDLVFEHRMYLPLAGVVAFVVIGGWDLLKGSLSAKEGIDLAWKTEAAIVAVVAVLFGFLTVQRNEDYRSAISIWSDTVAKRPNNPRARATLGFALNNEGRFLEAEPQLREAIRLQSDYAPAHINLGVTLMNLGRVTEAIEEFRAALAILPNSPTANKNLADILAQTGRTEEAITHYQKALETQPNLLQARNNLGLTLARQGELEGAIAQFSRVLQLDPNAQIAESNLALALMKLGRFEESLPHALHALALDPADVQAHYTAAVALEKKGHIADAVQQYEEVLHLQPNHAEARQRLANLSHATGAAR